MTAYLRIGPDFKHCHNKKQISMVGPCDLWAFDYAVESAWDGDGFGQGIYEGDSVWVKIKGLTDWLLVRSEEFRAFRASLEATP